MTTGKLLTPKELAVIEGRNDRYQVTLDSITPTVLMDSFAPLHYDRTALLTHIRAMDEQIEQSRKTNRRINRRNGSLKKAARENVEACQRKGVSLGRGLANWAYHDMEERADKAEATIARVEPLVEKWLGEQKQYPLGQVGSHAAVAVKLCANELKALLKQEQEDG